MQVTKVFEYDKNLEEIREFLVALGAKSRNKQGNFKWQISIKDCILTAYKSGKIVIQGKNKGAVEEVYDRLIENFGAEDRDCVEFVPHIGVDESGKGDYFGPLVVAGVFVPDSKINLKLQSYGIKDSKRISDSRIIELRNKIFELCSHRSVVVISPKKYNELYEDFRNVNKLLAWGHARVIENILEDSDLKVCKKVVVDQFSKSKGRVLDALMKNGKRLEIEQKHGGESDTAVAAASIFARARFLEHLKDMSARYDIDFPKGAGPKVVRVGKEFVRQYNHDDLNNVAKTTFRTTLKITSTFDI